jgi:ribosome-binding factor A
MAQKRRVYQVGDKIKEAIATQLHHLSDPRFSLVTIISVVMTPDLRQAKVYWVVTGGPSRRREVDAAFDSSAGLIRSQIGKGLGLRFMPEIRFYYDSSFDQQERMEALLKSTSVTSKETEDSEDDNINGEVVVS